MLDLLPRTEGQTVSMSATCDPGQDPPPPPAIDTLNLVCLLSPPSPAPTALSPTPCPLPGSSVPTGIPAERQEIRVGPAFPLLDPQSVPFLPMGTYTFPDSCSISSHWVCSNSDSAANKMFPCQEEEPWVYLRRGHPEDDGGHREPPPGPALLS